MYDNSYNCKVIRREENLILNEKINVKRRIKVKDVKGKDYEYTGTVTLLR